MGLAPLDPFMGEQIKTDAANVDAGWAQVAHINFPAADAVAKSADAVHLAFLTTTSAVAATAMVMALTAPTDTLTVTSTVALGGATNALSINLTTAAGDALSVTKSDALYQINIALANTTAIKNTAALIQIAIRALTTVGTVPISVAGVTCGAGGNWDTAAIATGELGPVSFANGITATPDVLTTLITNPALPRVISATAGGVGGDVGAIAVTIHGTNYNDEAITETLPVFVVNTPATKTGALAFKTVDRITIPAHDGNGASTSIGFGDSLGLPYLLSRDTILKVYTNNVVDTQTNTFDDTDLEKNTIAFTTPPAGVDKDIYLIVA